MPTPGASARGDLGTLRAAASVGADRHHSPAWPSSEALLLRAPGATSRLETLTARETEVLTQVAQAAPFTRGHQHKDRAAR